MIDFKVVTPAGRYLEEEAASIHARSVEGEFTLLPNHMPVIVSLVPCQLHVVEKDGQAKDYAISGGVLHFENNKATLLCDAIEGRAEIDIPRAKAALERARKRLEKQSDAATLRRNELALQRAINRLRVSGTNTD